MARANTTTLDVSRWIAQSRDDLRRPNGQQPGPAFLECSARWLNDARWRCPLEKLAPADRVDVLLELADASARDELAGYVAAVRETVARAGSVVPRGDEQALALSHLQHYFVTLADIVAGPSLAADELARERIRVSGVEHLEDALAAGKGVVLLSATQSHPGFALWLPQFAGLTLTAVANTRLDAEGLKSYLLSSLATRVELVPPSSAAVRPMLRRLKEGGLVAFYIDFRFPNSQGVMAPLLGKSVMLSRSAVAIAMRTESTVVPIVIARRAPWSSGVVDVQFFPPLPLDDLRFERDGDVERAAWRFGIALDALIRKAPATWRLWGLGGEF